MSRVHGWHGRLTRYLAEARKKPYEVGVHDCALFAAGAIEAITGVDLASSFRGRYDTIEQGMSLVNKEGFIDHIDMARAHFPSERPARAHIGDLAVVRIGESVVALGVVAGSRVYILGEKGVGVVGLMDRDLNNMNLVTEIFRVV